MLTLEDVKYIYRLSLVETQINDDGHQMTNEKILVYLSLFGVKLIAFVVGLWLIPGRICRSVGRGFSWLARDWRRFKRELALDWQAITESVSIKLAVIGFKSVAFGVGIS